MIPDPPAAPGLPGHTTIANKLRAIVVIFVVIIATVVGLFVMAYNVSVGVRAYIGAEGRWSKGQKDAVYFLNRYLGSADERDYRNYLSAIAIPLGDRKARLEMEKPRYDEALVTAGFVEGGVAAADVPHMVFLFRHFQSLPFFGQAVMIWRAAETELLLLPPIAEAARAAMLTGQLTSATQAALSERLDAVNTRVSPLEQQFSSVLADGAREVQALLLQMTLVIAAALMAIGALFAWSLARSIRSSVQGLREGAVRVAAGDLTRPIVVRSRDELGDLAHVFNSMIDARREAETALVTANQFREKVMENATNAIYTMDMEGRFTTANRRTCEITGYPLEELIGQTWAGMVSEADLPSLYEGYVSTVSGLTPITNREIALRRKNDETVTIIFSIAPLRREGVIFGVVGAAEDISARKRAELELNTRAEELTRSNQELEQFAYVASHDLQEPLRTVTGFAQLLARRYQDKLDGDAQEFIGYITDGVARMKSLIEDLLAYSRVQRAEAKLAPHALDSVLASALANLRGAITAAGAAVSHDPLPTLAVDVGQFSQLLQNLIGNAIKFRGEAPPRIHIHAAHQDAHWQFTVTDNGIGIDTDSAERVFVLFQRLHTRDRYEGNGIGLTICKKIVELHGGRIWVEPTPAGEQGSRFCFTVPQAPASAHLL